MNDYLQGKIDFVGQQRVELLVRFTLIVATVLSFVVGFALQSLQLTFGVFGLFTAALLLVVVPPWPMFNQHPVRWLAVKKKT